MPSGADGWTPGRVRDHLTADPDTYGSPVFSSLRDATS